ncbi:MAG: D-ribose ABC transporter substrate-binding protein [Candidatus Hydrogenedentota bacterium]
MVTRWSWGLLAIAVFAWTGCGGAPQDGAVPGATGSEPQSTETAGASSGDMLQIAVVPKGLGHQFWNTVKAGAEAAGKEFDAQIIWNGPAKETEVVKQINIIQDMVSKKVDGIVMAACDENALIDVIDSAMAAGIPVATIDSGVKSDNPLTFVATDNIEGAKAAARELAALIENKGKVGLLPFIKGAATSEMRESGFLEGIKEFPDLELVSTLYSQSDVAKAMNAVQDMMTANPDLKGIFVANEPGCLGAVRAIEAAGKSGEIKVVAFDASEDQIKALKAGTIHALVVQDPFKMGYEGVKALIDHLQGKPVEKRIDTGVTVVTVKNFDDPEVQKLLFPI